MRDRTHVLGLSSATPICKIAALILQRETASSLLGVASRNDCDNFFSAFSSSAILPTRAEVRSPVHSTCKRRGKRASKSPPSLFCKGVLSSSASEECKDFMCTAYKLLLRTDEARTFVRNSRLHGPHQCSLATTEQLAHSIFVRSSAHFCLEGSEARATGNIPLAQLVFQQKPHLTPPVFLSSHTYTANASSNVRQVRKPCPQGTNKVFEKCRLPTQRFIRRATATD